MGLPEMGRASHWETRIMRCVNLPPDRHSTTNSPPLRRRSDDAMSYGYIPAISSITLAAMEDLGFYLANYSTADWCVLW